MILNAYGVLDAFTTLLRLPLGLLVVGLAVSASYKFGREMTAEARTTWEDRCYLLFLLAVVLLGLNLVSWPLLYALLQSYVPQWPGVMCIYGVTQIGAGSQGLSRFLPGLLTALQVTKPAVVFLSGAWLVLYLVNRRTQTSALMPRVLILLVVFGMLTVTDAVLEGAYLVVPKQERFLDSGCCTAALDGTGGSRFLPRALLTRDRHPWLYAAYFGINSLMVAGLFARLRPGAGARAAGDRGLLPLLAGAIISIPISLVFLVEIAAPRILGLPYHHCPYDLLPTAPESVVGIGLFALGCFSVGWASLTTWSGAAAETGPAAETGAAAETAAVRREIVDKVLFLALFGYLASLVLFSVELVLV